MISQKLPPLITRDHQRHYCCYTMYLICKNGVEYFFVVLNKKIVSIIDTTTFPGTI